MFAPAGAAQLYVIPATAATVYVLVSPLQTFAIPPLTVMAPGLAMLLLVMLIVFAGPDPQLFDAVTDNVPGLENEAVKLNVTLFVPWPLVMVAPIGATQL